MFKRQNGLMFLRNRKAKPLLKSLNTGFTLIELLIALTIVTILAVSVYAALNPAQRLKDAKDARRASDVEEILTAIHQSIVDTKGTYPTNLPAAGTESQIVNPGITTGCNISNTNCTIVTGNCADLMSGGQNLAKYLKTLPLDPTIGTGSTAYTGYSVQRDNNGIVTVKACYTDAATTVSASR